MDPQPNEVLQDIRTESGLTQALFGARMGWTQGFISQLEAGTRPIAAHALAIADTFKPEMKRLGLSIEDLLRGRTRHRRGRRASANTA